MAAFDRKVTDFKPTVFMRSISTVAERLGFYKEEEIGKLFISPIPNQQSYLAHVIEQPNFRIPNPQYFVYLLDQTVGQDILQFIY